MAEHKKVHKTSKKQGGGLFFSVALGAALAAAAGYYATHKEEVDREAKKRIDQLAKAFKENRGEVEKRVRKVWGDVSDEAVATYLDVRGALLHALEEENMEKTGKMLRSQYDHLVEMAVKQARKSGLLNKDVEKKLEELFKMDWKDIQAILSSSAMKMMGTAKKEAKKMVKDVQKSAKKTTKKSVKRAVRKPVKKAVRKAMPKKKAVKKAVRKVTRRKK